MRDPTPPSPKSTPPDMQYLLPTSLALASSLMLSCGGSGGAGGGSSASLGSRVWQDLNGNGV